MISIDRDSPTPIFEQLTRQLRYLIATGHFQGRKSLPSTRKFAATLGVSFHTVRKAYQQLQKEGILESEVGSGYRVRDPAPLGTSERIERGAAIVQETLRRLAGLGLSPDDIDYLFSEQLSLLSTRAEAPKVVFAAASEEVAAMCAADLSAYLQRPVEPAALSSLSRHRDADYVVTEFRYVSGMREDLPRCDWLGVTTQLTAEVLDRVSQMLPSETVGLLTQETETVRYVTERMKYETRFAGQILATTSASSVEEVSSFATSVDLLLYTPAVARRVRRSGKATNGIELRVEITERSKRDSLEVFPTS